MAFDLPPLRIALYFTLVSVSQSIGYECVILMCILLQAIFSLILFGLSAARLHYTTHLPRGDPLNGGKDFYGSLFTEYVP